MSSISPYANLTAYCPRPSATPEQCLENLQKVADNSPNLISLDLSNEGFFLIEEALLSKTIAKMTRLSHLNLGQKWALEDDQLHAISAPLESLHLNATFLTHFDFKNLKSLEIGEAENLDIASILANNPELKELSLGNITLSDAMFDQLKQLTDLEVLDLSTVSITNDQITTLSKSLKKLKTLKVQGANDDNLSTIREELPALKTLNLIPSMISNERFQSELPRFTALSSLGINFNKPITDETVQALGNQKNLGELDLRHTGATESQVERLLAANPALRSLDLSWTLVTPAIRNSYPNVEIALTERF